MIAPNNRVKNAKEVTFSEDFKIGGRTYYEKNKAYYMHKDAAEKLKKRGAKLKDKSIDFEAEVEKAKSKAKK